MKWHALALCLVLGHLVAAQPVVDPTPDYKVFMKEAKDYRTASLLTMGASLAVGLPFYLRGDDQGIAVGISAFTFGMGTSVALFGGSVRRDLRARKARQAHVPSWPE